MTMVPNKNVCSRDFFRVSVIWTFLSVRTCNVIQYKNFVFCVSPDKFLSAKLTGLTLFHITDVLVNPEYGRIHCGDLKKNTHTLMKRFMYALYTLSELVS